MTKLIKKIVVIGPESTGKSTLSADLATHLQCKFVPEYARSYLESRGGKYQFTDLANIAKGQIKSEDQFAQEAKELIICDTDLYVLKVWSEHKYQKTDDYILQQIAKRKYDGYILCNIDLPWQYDPLREHPNLESRQYFWNLYYDIVQNSGCNFVIAKGTRTERLNTSLQAPWW